MQIEGFLETAVKLGASDLFVVAGRQVSCRINDKITPISENIAMPDETNNLVSQIYMLAGNRNIAYFKEKGDDDFSFAIDGLSRFRVSAYFQRGSMSAVIRVVSFELPDYRTMGIPESIIRMTDNTKGMILVTGPAGNGKSTTLSCMVNNINSNQEKHIITLEDPIEYLHSHKKSIVSQREVNVDTQNYVTALRAALRQSPDVILLGEMRDYETINVAMTAAETGHMILSTLHTTGAANTIDRIIDVFPAEQQHQIALQLSFVLRAVISQQLVPTVDGTLVPAFEIMVVNPAIRNMIRENKIPQIDGILYSSAGDDMISMDISLERLFKAGRITKETAMAYAVNPEMLSRRI